MTASKHCRRAQNHALKRGRRKVLRTKRVRWRLNGGLELDCFCRNTLNDVGELRSAPTRRGTAKLRQGEFAEIQRFFA